MISMSNLKGKVFISTQPEESFPYLEETFAVAGAKVLSCPMIKVHEAKLDPVAEEILRNIKDFDWLVFTSRNGARFFLKIYSRLNSAAFMQGMAKTAVIGRKTGEELIRQGITPDFISESNLAGKFASELKEQVLQTGNNVLLLLGNLAGSAIQDVLHDHTNIKRVDCYETTASGQADEKIVGMIAQDAYDMILFTSSSALESFAAMLRKHSIDITGLRMASIGPSTTDAMHHYGVKPVVTARVSSHEGLLTEIYEYYN
jgi:uroporphyrinogen-III synthase